MFKAVAVDIDGTFLTNQRDYDRPRFARILKELQRRQIRFIVASGDQFAFLHGLFPQHGNELSYVAENGVLVIDQQQGEIASGKLDPQTVAAVASFLRQQPGTHFTMCARHSAYVFNSIPEDNFVLFNKYYARLQKVASLDEIPEDVFKFALTLPPENTARLVRALTARFGDVIHPTVSGYGAIDLIIPHMNKGNGLRKLLAAWQLPARDLLVFGDNENDLSMFELAGKAYAMANAPAHVRAAADAIAPSNNDQGVLQVLEEQLKM